MPVKCDHPVCVSADGGHFDFLSIRCDRIWSLDRGVGHGPGTKRINFGDDPDHRQDPGVLNPKSGFTGLSQKVPSGLRSKLHS